MTEKNKEWTIPSIKKEVNKLIRFGMSESSIMSILFKEIKGDLIDRDMLSDLIRSTVEEHPSYELIQLLIDSKLIIDISSTKSDVVTFLNLKEQIIDTISDKQLATLLPKYDFSGSKYYCKHEYHPRIYTKLFKDGKMWKYNIYESPFWLEEFFWSKGKSKPKKEIKIPEMYDKFLNHLVDGDKASYEYILDWLSTALKDRNYCILTTIGEPGIGKGVLGEIMRQVFGSSNFVKTESRLLSKDFNAQIKNKQIIYIDELQIKNVQEENKIKALINDKIEIEGKGADAIEVDNYASVYVSSNNLDSIRIPSNDRRFSIVELTDKKLITSLKKEQISELLKNQNIEKFARFLFYREVDSAKMMLPFRGKRTEMVRESSLKEWEEYVVEDLWEKYKGEKKLLNDIADNIEDLFGSRSRPGRAAFNRLQSFYGDKINIIRPSVKSGPRPRYIEFLKVKND